MFFYGSLLHEAIAKLFLGFSKDIIFKHCEPIDKYPIFCNLVEEIELESLSKKDSNNSMIAANNLEKVSYYICKV